MRNQIAEIIFLLLCLCEISVLSVIFLDISHVIDSKLAIFVRMKIINVRDPNFPKARINPESCFLFFLNSFSIVSSIIFNDSCCFQYQIIEMNIHCSKIFFTIFFVPRTYHTSNISEIVEDIDNKYYFLDKQQICFFWIFDLAADFLTLPNICYSCFCFFNFWYISSFILISILLLALSVPILYALFQCIILKVCLFVLFPII